MNESEMLAKIRRKTNMAEKFFDFCKQRQDQIWILPSFQEVFVYIDRLNVRILSYLAYSFKDGPWKHTYVRFGYDPRAEPTSFIYQVIDVGVLDNTTKYESLVQSYKRNEL